MSAVFVSTHHLPMAGRLREAFRASGFKVDLVTPSESLALAGDAVLLVLTAPAGEAQPLVRQAAPLGIPVLVVSPEREAPLPEPGGPVLETFGPGASAEEVALVGRRIVDRRRLQRETGIIGETEAMREVLERVVQIAPTPSTVLITGESGTGKELVARGLHALSPRRHKRFIAVNVAALPDTLLESELFGHEKGAFTGAIDSRRGLFELAHGGTIFLDEIGEMPLATQTKLLRVLEQREFMRVGGEENIRVDVRIITATNQDLRQLVALREFRRDLYYRLNVLSIQLPALRERRADIPLLVSGFVREVSERLERPFPGITAPAMEILQGHHWPGNVRELRNLIESMVVLAPGHEILPADIPPEVRGGASLLPVLVPRATDGAAMDSALRPQLEFIFRTMVELRVDMDDLRREFDSYRQDLGVRRLPATAVGAIRVGPAPGEIQLPENGVPAAAPVESGVVIYRPGMTMDDLEKSAIMAALSAEGGNRRRAADVLGIGERTLYRKIKQYGLEV